MKQRMIKSDMKQVRKLNVLVLLFRNRLNIFMLASWMEYLNFVDDIN